MEEKDKLDIIIEKIDNLQSSVNKLWECMSVAGDSDIKQLNALKQIIEYQLEKEDR